MIIRKYNSILNDRLHENRQTIQVVAGPRQVGKTTMVKQVLKAIDYPSLFFNADTVNRNDTGWISSCWEEARAKMRFGEYTEYILAIDEIQKIENWSEQVKREWDYDTFNDINIKVILLGSSRMLMKKGLTESLAGRFEMITMGHWSYAEMHEAFDWDMNRYIYFGGYPGSASFVKNETRWRNYMRDAIVGPAIEKDVLLTSTIYKPALLGQLFRLGCAYSGELLAYNKMLGMLQDAGNATTLATYTSLLQESHLLAGLQKYSTEVLRKYRSIPKWQVYNNALLTVMTEGMTFEKAYTSPQLWGRWVESAVGCYLLDKATELGFNLYYWRENNDEVDFVIQRGSSEVAIEVKSGHRQMNSGIPAFRQRFRPRYVIVVGGDAMPLEQFFAGNIAQLLN